MPDMVMAAMGSLIPKLGEVLKEEYRLQAGMKERIINLTKELELARAALRKVGEVPWDQLDELIRLWAREVRESSYDMEDVVDTFLVRVQGPYSAEQEKSLLKPLKKLANFFKKTKARRKISGDIKDIMSHLQVVTERYHRYMVNDNVAGPATDIVRRPTISTVDPRLHVMYTQVNKLVGIDESSSGLKSKLQLVNLSNMKMKTISIVGIGGLGKTTLAKAVYDNLRGDFNYRAFVSVGRNPDLKKVLQMILTALDKERYQKYNFAVKHDISQFIDELREFLEQNKRSLIVIDDLWDKLSWETLKFAIPGDKNCEARIIITTRKWEIAENADEVYELPPLPYDSSRKLFYSRIYGDDVKCIDYQQPDDVSDEILRKCAGIPLAIITMASLLAHKPRDKWLEVYKRIGFGSKGNDEAERSKGNEEAENTSRILSFSYYDLPSHLRTCLLYLTAFPEDSVISKSSLVWMWVAEGFIRKQEGKGLFEIGEVYFNDLVNRSVIQEIEPDYKGNYIYGCRVHDMVLDFIRSMSREENLFTVFDNNDQGTIVRSNVVRRLAHHNMTMVHSNQAKMFDMSKVRSYMAPELVIDTWAPLSMFKLLRVLNIGYYDTIIDNNRDPVELEPLGQLFHLRFLGVNGRWIERIPKEIGALKFLQTLDLRESCILELPSSSSFPTQLVCLRMVFGYMVRDAEVFPVGRLTSLEELSIDFAMSKASRRLLKELGNLRELRVLDAPFRLIDTEMERDLIESLRHLHKLQHLKIGNSSSQYAPLFLGGDVEFVLPCDLRYLVLFKVVLRKLPSCIDGHINLSHLDLSLWNMNMQELKILGGLPELCFLALDLQGSSPTISNISDSGSSYFPKLRCLILRRSLVLFVVNNGDDKKTTSFRIWDGEEDGLHCEEREEDGCDDARLQSDDEYEFSVSQLRKGRGPIEGKNDDELQLQRLMAMLSVSDDELPSPFQPSKLQHGATISDEEKKGSVTSSQGQGVATPRFMPRLQVLHFQVRGQAVRDPHYCNSLGLEFLSTLQEISVHILAPMDTCSLEVEVALRREAQVHPNHPTICFDYSPYNYHY